MITRQREVLEILNSFFEVLPGFLVVVDEHARDRKISSLGNLSTDVMT